MLLLGIDSMGKLSRNQYCFNVCKNESFVDDTPVYKPGGTLLEIMSELTQRVKSKPNSYSSVAIVSMQNGLDDISFGVYAATGRQKYLSEISNFVESMNAHNVATLVVFGGHPSIWPYTKPLAKQKEYLKIQQDILNEFKKFQVHAYTGCEPIFSGGLWKFTDQVDHMGHILGTSREEAVEWLQSVLRYQHGSHALPAPPGQPTPQPTVSATPLPLPGRVQPQPMELQLADAAAGPPKNPQLNLQDIVLQELQQMQPRSDKQEVFEYVKKSWTNQTEPFLCNVRSPGEPFSHTVLICTSGTERTQNQTSNALQWMTYLGFRPFVVHGLKPTDHPPKKWKVGCKASMAWHSVLMPKIIHFVRQHLRPGELLLVAEDSVWPTDQCTPQRVKKEYGNPLGPYGLWLGASRGPHEFRFEFGNSCDIRCIATNGCKLIAGNGEFWALVNEVFQKTDKGWSSDAVFQLLTAIGLLKIVDPFLAVSDTHFSERTNKTEPRSQFHLEVRPKLRPICFDGNLLRHPQEA